MDNGINIWHIFILVGAIQGFILSGFLLFHPIANKTPNRILSILIFIVSYDNLTSFLYLSNYIFHTPHLIAISDPLYSVYGPLIYLYTRYLTTPGYRFTPRTSLIFLPCAINILFYIPFFIKPADVKIHEFINFHTEHLLVMTYWLSWISEIAYNIIFIIVSGVILKRHLVSVKNTYSNLAKVSLMWLRQCIYIALILFLFQIVIAIVSIFSENVLELLFIFFCYIIAVLIYGIGYKGLRQPELFLNIEKSASTEKNKYNKSSLSDDAAQAHLCSLLALMENEKAYLDNNLGLKELSNRLSISTNHLSQVINVKVGRNFYDFINSYRVREAQNLLLSPDHRNLTMLAIAFEAGFSSKSSFNKVFKEHTGKTPTEFRKMQ